MNLALVSLLALGIGFVTGLRSLTAPAAVAWAAHLGWLNLHGSPLAFVGSTTAVVAFSLAAIGEYVGDKLPATPSRTSPFPLVARILIGGLCGACIFVAVEQSLVMGAILGVIGSLVGAFGGYQARTRLVHSLKVKDILVAIPEDLIAIGLAYWIVSR